jgi:G3E family GTPase
VLLDQGCLCCTISDSLSETLADLVFRRAKGTIPPFSRVIIETSGLADPAPILHCLMTDRLIRDHYSLGGLICVIDALHGPEQLQTTPEVLKQLSVADRIILSKTDMVSATATAEVRDLLSARNPRADIEMVVDGKFEDLDRVLKIDPLKSLDIAADAPHSRDNSHDHAHDHTHDHAHGSVGTETFVLPNTVTWAGYDYWVRHLQAFRGADLLRIKGVIGLEERNRPHFIQGVQHVFGAPEPLDAWPWPDQQGRLVFITRDMDRATLERSLDCLQAPEGIRQPIMLEAAI